MKKALIPILFASCVIASCSSHSQPMPKIAATTAGNGFAVVELFTSQGCSSCPSADALLGKEIAASAAAGKKLIALSFHVDYWNRLGWTDPFSKHEFSQRQYGYSAKMNGDGVYTPQAVVNGQSETVGSNQAKLDGFIKQAYAEKPAATVSISSVMAAADSLKIAYQYNGTAASLNIAVVERQINTPVKAGENEGRNLTNYNVVKSWKSVAAQSGNATATIQIPAGYKAANYAVVLYAQENNYGKILAADMQ